MSPKPFYITTAISYANAAPHIGHAFEFVTADVHARYRKSLGEEVYFVTGMDEHGQKIEQKAKEQGIGTQDFVDANAQLFQSLDKEISVDYDFFVRTSDKEKHQLGAQVLWNKLVEAKAIEKKAYKALYCIGCEEFKREIDLNEKGECPIHFTKPDVVEEENYFFKLSNYTEEIKSKIINDDLKIYPESRKNEILGLLERGLEDVSFSRPKSKVSWGIPVPNDDAQVMYVWCDALSNYITAIGYGTENFKEDLWSNTTHVIGKDILRFHAAIWPGMLLAAGLPLPKRILVHGFITSGGHKMSKSLGNVLDPKDLLELFQVPAGELAGEALRFILLHEIPSFEDGDMTMDSIKASYTSNLVNGIGNLTSRVLKLVEDNAQDIEDLPKEDSRVVEVSKNLNDFDAKKASEEVMRLVHSLDEKIQKEEVFKVIKGDRIKGLQLLQSQLAVLQVIAKELSLFMPKTSSKILDLIENKKKPEKPLFNRLS